MGRGASGGGDGPSLTVSQPSVWVLHGAGSTGCDHADLVQFHVAHQINVEIQQEGALGRCRASWRTSGGGPETGLSIKVSPRIRFFLNLQHVRRSALK